jgi:hypothetical protein
VRHLGSPNPIPVATPVTRVYLSLFGVNLLRETPHLEVIKISCVKSFVDVLCFHFICGVRLTITGDCGIMIRQWWGCKCAIPLASCEKFLKFYDDNYKLYRSIAMAGRSNKNGGLCTRCKRIGQRRHSDENHIRSYFNFLNINMKIDIFRYEYENKYR